MEMIIQMTPIKVPEELFFYYFHFSRAQNYLTKKIFNQKVELINSVMKDTSNEESNKKFINEFYRYLDISYTADEALEYIGDTIDSCDELKWQYADADWKNLAIYPIIEETFREASEILNRIEEIKKIDSLQNQIEEINAIRENNWWWKYNIRMDLLKPKFEGKRITIDYLIDVSKPMNLGQSKDFDRIRELFENIKMTADDQADYRQSDHEILFRDLSFFNARGLTGEKLNRVIAGIAQKIYPSGIDQLLSTYGIHISDGDMPYTINEQLNEESFYPYDSITGQIKADYTSTEKKETNKPENNDQIKSYPDGSRYNGQFQNGKREGRGIMTYPNGIQYSGLWKNDKEDGSGILTSPNGNKYVGLWKDGEKLQGSFYGPNWEFYYSEDILVNTEKLPVTKLSERLNLLIKENEIKEDICTHNSKLGEDEIMWYNYSGAHNSFGYDLKNIDLTGLDNESLVHAIKELTMKYNNDTRKRLNGIVDEIFSSDISRMEKSHDKYWSDENQQAKNSQLDLNVLINNYTDENESDCAGNKKTLDNIIKFPVERVKREDQEENQLDENFISDYQTNGFCRTEFSRRDLVHSPTMVIPPFDRMGFHEDMYYLLKFRNNPQEMIDKISVFSATYMWPVQIASLAYFEKAGDMSSLSVFNAGTTFVFNVGAAFITRDKDDWDFENKNSVVNGLINEKNLSYYHYILIDQVKHDDYYKVDKIIEKIIELAPKNAEVFNNEIKRLGIRNSMRTEKDRKLILKDNTPGDKAEISSAMLLPVFDADKRIKAVVFLGYNHPAVMCGTNGFTRENIWDVYMFMNALQMIYQESPVNNKEELYDVDKEIADLKSYIENFPNWQYGFSLAGGTPQDFEIHQKYLIETEELLKKLEAEYEEIKARSNRIKNLIFAIEDQIIICTVNIKKNIRVRENLKLINELSGYIKIIVNTGSEKYESDNEIAVLLSEKSNSFTEAYPVINREIEKIFKTRFDK